MTLDTFELSSLNLRACFLADGTHAKSGHNQLKLAVLNQYYFYWVARDVPLTKSKVISWLLSPANSHKLDKLDMPTLKYTPYSSIGRF